MPSGRGTDLVPAPALVLGGIVSVQFGGALAATLLPLVGVAGSVGLRLGIAAALLVGWTRPSLRARSRGDWLAVIGYAVSLGAMNLCFYASLQRLPIGVAVTIEFVGPLLLSAVLSRRPRDLVAVVCAAAGVLLVSGAAQTSLGDLDLRGIGLALAAGGFWASYILASRRTGRHFSGLDGLAVAMLLATLVVLPIGAFEAGGTLLRPDALLKGAGIAVLSSVLPYSLELIALRRLQANVFGILLSLEPVAATLAGLIVLHQRISPIKLCGMALVVTASALVLGARRKAPQPRD